MANRLMLECFSLALAGTFVDLLHIVRCCLYDFQKGFREADVSMPPACDESTFRLYWRRLVAASASIGLELLGDFFFITNNDDLHLVSH
jgi:hypothetical protein